MVLFHLTFASNITHTQTSKQTYKQTSNEDARGRRETVKVAATPNDGLIDCRCLLFSNSFDFSPQLPTRNSRQNSKIAKIKSKGFSWEYPYDIRGAFFTLDSVLCRRRRRDRRRRSHQLQRSQLAHSQQTRSSPDSLCVRRDVIPITTNAFFALLTLSLARASSGHCAAYLSAQFICITS